MYTEKNSIGSEGEYIITTAQKDCTSRVYFAAEKMQISYRKTRKSRFSVRNSFFFPLSDKKNEVRNCCVIGVYYC